jgi:two-component system sensor histidine kinase KdpD
MNRLQTGSMDVLDQSTDVRGLITAAVRTLGPRGDDVMVDVEAPLPPIRTDPVLLERAVANLIDNALTHAGGNGLRIEAGPVAGRVDIRVIDRGPGIPREDRDMVFQPFLRQGDSEHRVGVGLGLAVARGFVEAVGGDLDVEDTPGGGCTMVVRLPEAPAGAKPGTTGDAPPGPIDGRPAADTAERRTSSAS